MLWDEESNKYFLRDQVTEYEEDHSDNELQIVYLDGVVWGAWDIEEVRNVASTFIS